MKKLFYIHRQTFWKSNEECSSPDVSFVPPMQRRRLSEIEKISLFLANSAVGNETDYRSVFASDYGEWKQTIQLIQQFFEEKSLSPAKFSISVHNASAGLFSLIKKNDQSYTCIAANERTIENGLLECFISKKPCLFVFSEETTPDFYKPVFKNPFIGHGVSFFLSEEELDFPIEIEFKHSKQNPLSFDELLDFIQMKKNAIQSSCFILRQCK